MRNQPKKPSHERPAISDMVAIRDPFKSDIVTRTNVLFRHLPDYLQGEVERQLRLEEEGDWEE